MEKPAKKQPPSTKKNLHELRLKPKKLRTYSENLSPTEARSGSHQKLKIVIRSKAVQERREEGFVQKKYDEVGSANDGSWGRTMGGQWCELKMGGDERVVAL